MKLFLDTADVATIEEAYSTGLIDGLTTNPTLMMKSGEIPDKVYYELKHLGIKDISMEVVADTSQAMLEEASRLIGLFGECVTIKVPCTPEGLKACREMANQNIRVNVTLIFSAAQAILSAKAGATYVSPFVGRVYDQHWDGRHLIEEIADVFATHQIKTEVLAASIREPIQVTDAFRVGADICTISVPIFYQLYKHVLTDKGLEKFDQDWQKLVGG